MKTRGNETLQDQPAVTDFVLCSMASCSSRWQCLRALPQHGTLLCKQSIGTLDVPSWAQLSVGGGQAHNSHSVIYLLSGHIFKCLNFEPSPSVSVNDFLEALLKWLQENNSGIYGNSPHYAEMYQRYQMFSVGSHKGCCYASAGFGEEDLVCSIKGSLVRHAFWFPCAMGCIWLHWSFRFLVLARSANYSFLLAMWTLLASWMMGAAQSRAYFLLLSDA